MENNIFKNKIRNLVHQMYKSPKTEDDPFEPYGDFSKFPELKTVILTLMTVDFGNFVDSIDWVAPKPTTFCVKLISGEYFFLIFNKRGWVVNIEGKKYFIMNLEDEKKAVDAISRLLYYSPSSEGENYDTWDSDLGSDKKKSSSSSSSSSSSYDASGSNSNDGTNTDTTTGTTTDEE